MTELSHTIWEQFVRYKGEGMIPALFFCSLIYMNIRHGRSTIERSLANYSLLAIAVFFMPITMYLLMPALEDFMYWRVMWIVPIIIVIAYVCTDLPENLKSVFKRVLCVAMCVCIIALCGKWIYIETNYQNVENAYKLPDNVITLSNEILERDSYPFVLSPIEIAPYFRQYDGNIKLVYGREGKIDTYDNYETRKKILEIFNNQTLSLTENYDEIESFFKLVGDIGVNYIIVRPDMQVYPFIARYRDALIGKAGDYEIYEFGKNGVDDTS